MKIQLWPLPAGQLNDVRNEAVIKGGRHSHRDIARTYAAHFLELVAGGIQFVKDETAPLLQDQAHGRGADSAGVAIQQARARYLFKPADGLAQRGLAYPKVFCCLGDAAKPADFDEILEVSGMETAHF